jgi:hypothetical protein
MALTFTRLTSGAATTGPQGAGGVRPLRTKNQDDVVCVFGAITFDTTYTTGGLSCPASSIGLKEVFFWEGDGAVTGGAIGNAGSAVWPKYDYNNQTVMLFGGGALTVADKEVPQGTNMSWATCRFMAFGRK